MVVRVRGVEGGQDMDNKEKENGIRLENPKPGSFHASLEVEVRRTPPVDH